jgi:hypothetical protein
MTTETTSTANYPPPDQVAARFVTRRLEVERLESAALRARAEYERDVNLFLGALEK